MSTSLRWLGAAALFMVMVPPAWSASTADKHDCTAAGVIDPGQGPALSVLDVDYGAFLYPRTLPMKAAATDTDLLTVRCEACDGSEAQVPIADDVHPGIDPRSGYRWVITAGEGSLNGPYDVRPIVAAEATLDGARTTLERHRRASREATELVEAAQTVVNALESRRAKLADRLDAALERVNRLTRALGDVHNRERAVETLLEGPEARLEVLRAEAAAALAESLGAALSPPSSAKEAVEIFKAQSEAQASLDTQIDRLMSRLSLLEAQLPRAVNLPRVARLEAQIAQLEPQLRTRHAVTCKFATEAVPLLLTLKSSDGGTRGLKESQRVVRDFLTLCESTQVPDYETLVRLLPMTGAICEHMAHGLPSPSPVELEILPMCGALYHERQVISQLRELHRRLEDVHNAGASENPRREMKAIRAKLRTLNDERVEVRSVWAKAQRAHLDQRMDAPMVSDEVRAARDVVDAQLAALSSAVASGRQRLRSLRDRRRQVEDQRVEADAQWRDTEAEHRGAEAELAGGWQRAQDAVSSARLSTGEIATAEGRIKDAEKVLASHLAAPKVNTKAVGQVAWYSPPPLPLLLAAEPTAKRELTALSETRRKAAAELVKLEEELAQAQADQLARLESLTSGLGGFKALLVGQRQLEQRRRQVGAELQGHVQGAIEVAETHREALRLARIGIDSLRTEEAFAALVPRYESLRSERQAAYEAINIAKLAVAPSFDTYAEQLERQQIVRGELVDKIVEMKIAVATSLQFRAKAFESRRHIAMQHTFDTLLKALEVGRAVRLKSEDDRGHREGIKAAIEAAQAAIRKDEQGAEDTKALVAAQLSELTALTDKAARIASSLSAARAAYQAARAQWAQAIAALDDHDAQIVATRAAIAERWVTGRAGALELWRMLGGDVSAGEGEYAYLISAILRDARLANPADLERFRIAVVAKVDAFSGHELVARPDSFKTLDPLVTAARDRLHDLEKTATDRRSVSELLPGTRLATLHRARDRAVAALAANQHARSAHASSLDTNLREAKRRRDRVMSTALADARGRAAAAEEQYFAQRETITRRLVARLSVTLSLEATDRGAAAGRADDPPATTTVRLTFSEGLRPSVSSPPVPDRVSRPSSRNKGTCKAIKALGSGKRHEWSQVPELPKTVYAGEAIGVVATTRDVDRVTPSCEARDPGCRRGPRAKPLDIDEFHPVTWSVDNAEGFSGGAGHLVGGQTTAAGIFVSPASSELMENGSPMCEKPVVLSVTSLVDGDLTEEPAPAARQATVLVKAGVIRASSGLVSALPGQPVEVRFEIFKLGEDGVPLAANAPFEDPLDGQRVTLTVARISGEEVAGVWGFDGTKRTINTVSREGVIRETLTLAKAPGRYRVMANWRQGEACQASVDVITPRHLASRLVYAPTHPAWMAAVLELAERGQASEAELTQRVKALVSSTSSVDMNDDWSGADELGVDSSGLTRAEFVSSLQSWTIVSDRDHRPVAGQTLRVTATDRGGVTGRVGQARQAEDLPAEFTSDGLGLVRVQVGADGVTASAYPSVTQRAGVRVERTDIDAATYQAGAYPAGAHWNTDAGIQRAWIGPESSIAAPSERLRLDLARAAMPGRLYSGEATLVAPIARGDDALGEITLARVHLNGVTLDKDGIVRSGVVVFDAGKSPESGCTTLKGGGNLCVLHLTARAGHDATWNGLVTLPLAAHGEATTLVGPLRFSGSWTPGDGAVLTLLDSLPKLPALSDGSASIERGALATLDMSHRVSAPGLPATWRGLYLHRGRLALDRLRSVSAEGDAPSPSPVLRMGETVWEWPFTEGVTAGGLTVNGLDLPLPGLHDATLTGASLDLRRGALTVQALDVALRLPGTRDPVQGRLSTHDGTWRMDLTTPSPVRLGEWATLRLRPGASAVTGVAGMSRLQGEVEVTVPGLGDVRMTGLDHDPQGLELHLKSGALDEPSRFADRFAIGVTGGAVDTSRPADLLELPGATVRIAGTFAIPSGPPAPGHVTLTTGTAGVDVIATFKAAPHFAGVDWRGDLTYTRGDFVGPLTPGEGARRGLGRVATPPMDVRLQLGEGAAAHLTLHGTGTVPAPEAEDDPAAGFFNTPYVAVAGAIGVGWHHSASDHDFLGYADYDAASPLVTEGALVLSDQGAGATLAAEVAFTYAHGRDPVASLDGTWTYFNRPGVVMGRGAARVNAVGTMTGAVALQLDIDTPGGELLHVVSPTGFIAHGSQVDLATGRFEGLMQEAAVHVAGDVRVTVDVKAKTAEAVLSGAMRTRATWEWPPDDSLGVLQVDLITRGELPLHFEGDGKRGVFTLAPTATRWSGVVSGPLNLGFTNSIIETTTATGTGFACFPRLCLKADMSVPVEQLGFAFDLGRGWLEVGNCDRGCEP